MASTRHSRALALVAGVTLGMLVAVLANATWSTAKPGATAGPQADSVIFDLQFSLQHTESGAHWAIGHVVYCGVAGLAEPYRLDVLVTSPPNLTDPADPNSTPLPGHDAAGWLHLQLQEETEAESQDMYRVPTNDSLALGLTLGGRPNQDQLVQINSWPLGDVDGGGTGFHGVASVLAQPGATDPFVGDGRDDNYCVSIGVEPNPTQPDQVTLPGEYLEGQLSVTMPVPDGWVVDGDGSDGGVLSGFPH